MSLKIGHMTDKEALENLIISDDLRLAKVFENHKDEIEETNKALYDALERWKWTHMVDLADEEKRLRCNPKMNDCWSARRYPLPYREMEDCRVNLNDAAWYMVDMFQQTQKYSAGRTKIAKLLSIAAFKYAVYNGVLFSENIYRYPNCGCYIRELNGLIDMSPYVLFEYHDSPTMIPTSEIEKIGDPVCKYAKCLTDEAAKTVLKTVFINFGAYSVKDLSDCLNPIVETPGMTDEDGKILLNKFSKMALSDFEGYESNKVLQYIYE